MATQLTLFLKVFSLRFFLFLYRRHFLNILQRQCWYLATKNWGFTPFLTVHFSMKIATTQNPNNANFSLRNTRLGSDQSRTQSSLSLLFEYFWDTTYPIHDVDTSLCRGAMEWHKSWEAMGREMFGKKYESSICKMVLNIAGFSIHTYHFHISEIILLIVAIILEVASSLCLSSVKTICAGQCLLFAKMFERARILQGSNTTWCFLPLFFNFVAGSSSLLLLGFIRGGRSR